MIPCIENPIEQEGNLRLIGCAETNKVMGGELMRLVKRGLRGVRLPDPKKEGTGQLLYPFTHELAHLAVHHHRTCSRVYWDLYTSRASRLEPLYDELLRQVKADARNWWWDGAGISIRARNVGAFSAGERQVVGTVKNALIDGAKERGIRLHVDPESPDIGMGVRMHDDLLTVSIDLAGRPMNKRGYRMDGAVAPIRENLAAVCVMLARYDARSEILFDPMSGSATIAIEAALMARATPIWSARNQPAHHRLPPFADLAKKSPSPLFADTRPCIVANELNDSTYRIAQANIKAAGVGNDIIHQRGDFRDIKAAPMMRGLPFDKGIILCNPPYGERVGGEDVTALYRDLKEWLVQFKGWRAAFIVAHPEFEANIRMRPRIKKPLSAKPFRGYFYLYDL
jgi:23S rRNA G2445 N2-methylase RlmL